MAAEPAGAGALSGSGALLDDYRALRQAAGARWVARDVLSVTGPDAAAYLQGQCSQDLEGLAVGAAADALLLEPDGKLVALVRVLRTAGDGFAVDVDGGFGEPVAARLARFRLRTKVDIGPLDWRCLSLRGPLAADAAVAVGNGVPGVYVLPFTWHGVRGADVLGPAPAGRIPEPDGVRWCGEAAWEALRVEAGIPAMGRELDGRTIAAEAGLVGRAVSLTKGCYTGQELVARLDARGNRVARRLCGVVAAHPAADGEAVGLEGLELMAAGRPSPVGTVTSAAWCPGLGGPAGLAYVHRSVDVPGGVAARAGGDTAAATVVGGDTAARPAGASGGEAVEVEVRALPLVAG